MLKSGVKKDSGQVLISLHDNLLKKHDWSKEKTS